jgi:hypothetical protein
MSFGLLDLRRDLLLTRPEYGVGPCIDWVYHGIVPDLERPVHLIYQLKLVEIEEMWQVIL